MFYRSEQTQTPLRVLHLVSSFELKTDTKWLLQLLAALPRERVKCAIGAIAGGGETMACFARLGLPAFNLATPGEANPAAIWRAYRLIRTWRPQIVHTHLLRADLYGGLAARLARVPVVLSTAYAIGQFRREKVRRLDGVLDAVCRRLAGNVLAVSGAVREDLQERLHWPASRVHVIHTGVKLPESAGAGRGTLRAEWGVADGAALAVTVARLSYEKGIGCLIEAARQVHLQVPDARFVVVGDGPLRDSLSQKIQASGLTDIVRLAGFRRDIDAVLAAADLFVLPSLMEGMPNALLEAWAAGLPVIATAAGGPAEIIEHEHNGLLVPPGDSGRLAAAIHRLIQDRSLHHKIVAGAKCRVLDFEVGRVAGQYADLYERLYRAGETCGQPAPRRAAALPNSHVDSEAFSKAAAEHGPSALPPAIDFFGLPVRPLRREALLRAIVERARAGIRTELHYLNAWTFNIARDDASFWSILAHSDLLYADGMSIVWAARLCGNYLPERLSAADYFEELCRCCAAADVPIFLLGGREGTAADAAKVLAERNPGLRIVGTNSGFISEAESREIVGRINASGARLLIVGMGSPLQEGWLARYGPDLHVPVRWSVGALLDYVAGREARAPQWLCRYGGEWLFRLLHRPAERWRRYLIGNPRFAWFVLKERLAVLRDFLGSTKTAADMGGGRCDAPVNYARDGSGSTGRRRVERVKSVDATE